MEKLQLLIVLLKLFSLEVLSDSYLPRPPYCGKPNLANSNARIFNGNITGIDEYPWMGHLTYTVVYRGFLPPYSASCTSSLITSNWVLTAGHCVFNASVELTPLFFYKILEVILGVWYLNDFRNSIKLFGEAFVHPYYYNYITAHYNSSYDIALLRLQGNVELSPYSYIQRSCLPLESIPIEIGSKVVATGWGQYASDTRSDVKRKTTLTVSDLSPCRKWLPHEHFYDEYQICVVGPESGVCKGDSGGPLLLQPLSNENTFYQIGVTSLGRQDCTYTSEPSVYVRVDTFINWISGTIQQNDRI